LNWLSHIKLGQKLIGAFVIGALLTLAVGCFGIYNQNVANLRADVIYRENLLAIQELAAVQKNILLHARTLVRAMTQITNPDQQSATLQRVEGYWLEEQKAWDMYMQTTPSDAEIALRREVLEQTPSYLALTNAAIKKMREGNISEASDLVNGEVRESSKRLESTLDKLIQNNADQAAAVNKSGDIDAAHAILLTMGAIAASVLFALVIGGLLTKSMGDSIKGAIAAARRITSNDLTHSVAVQGSDEIAQLSTALRDMQETLRNTLQHISGSSSQLAAASEELHAVTEDMSRSMNVQNDQLQMAAAAVTEMSAAVDEVARSANATSESSASAEATVQHGRKQVSETKLAIDDLSQIVGETSGSMYQLSSQVEAISGVLDVIGAIAEQTNLLALNAAIEAARAGEQGRGFSVVADEVRALAARTQASTREIAVIIDKVKTASQVAANSMQISNEKAQLTRELADGADLALARIAAEISRINEMNLTIASASEEQAQTAREVDRNLVAIKDFGSQNATGALQTSASSNDLARIATELNAMVGQFSL
jgi:methyl-accepting chemotaxis protein